MTIVVVLITSSWDMMLLLWSRGAMTIVMDVMMMWLP
jgi:hypothetical protein